MSTKSKKQDGDLHISGNVTVTGGDFVAGDKNVASGAGSVLVGGDMQGGNIVTGDHNQISQDAAVAELFAQLLQKIDERPNTPPQDKEDLKANVAEIRAEVKKGEQADESFLARRIRNIERIAPDIADVVLSTLASPAAGLAMVAKKIAERMQKASNA
jgi:hypothetical protein